MNRIYNLTSGVFSHLHLCARLDLMFNRITLIEPGAFAGLTSLTSLDLSLNRLTKLTSGVFSQLSGCASFSWLGILFLSLNLEPSMV